MRANKRLIKLSTQSVALKFFLTLAVALIIGALVYQQVLQSKLAVIQSTQNEKLLLINTEFAKELSSIKKLTQLLAANASLKQVNLAKQPLAEKLLRKKINQYFLDFGLLSPNIAQIRWIDIAGNEIFRSNFDKGKGEIVKPDRLQKKISRYYFNQGIPISAPNVFLSKIDLNMEYGKLVMPLEPTVRATYRTSSSDYIIDGLIIINFNLTHLFDKIRSNSTKDAQINIVNHDSFWLFSHTPALEWGFMQNKRQLTVKNLQSKLWNEIISQKNSHISKYVDSNIYTLGKLNIFFRKNQEDAINDNVYVYISSAEETLADLKYVALQYGLTCSFILLLIGVFFIYREQRYQQVLQRLFDELKAEAVALDSVNKELDTTIKQQHLLQDSLIEAQKLSSLGLLVAGVAHEMNTPIGGAIMSVSNAEIAVRRIVAAMASGLTKSQLEKNTASIENNLGLARVNLDKAAVLVKSFKRMAIDRKNEDIVACDISKIIEDLLITLHAHIKKSKVQIKTQFLTNATIHSRPGIISQVVENLIMNALDHGFKKNEVGEIELKVEKTEGNLIKISVSDTGVGIKKTLKKSIFEPFFTSARGKGNTGLGLYMVYQWVTKVLKGEIHVESDPITTERFKTKFIILLSGDED